MGMSPTQLKAKKHWNVKSTFGNNVIDKWVPFAENHPGSTEGQLLDTIQSLKPKVIEKINDLSASYEGKISTKKIENNCDVCGTGFKYGRKFKLHMNGQSLHHGEEGLKVGEDCYDTTMYLFNELKQEDCEMRTIEKKEWKKDAEHVAKHKVALDTLVQKVVKKLTEEGFDLKSRISSDVVNSVQKQIVQGDFSGVEREVDPGKCTGIFNWLIANRNTIYDGEVRNTVALLIKNPKRVTGEQLADAILYEWQERKWKASGELANIKEDIHYLAELSQRDLTEIPKRDPRKRTIRKYGKVDLDTYLTPVKVFSRTRWKPLKLRQALGDLTKDQEGAEKGKDSVSKAQTRGVRYSVPYLQRRREYHNLQAIKSVCDTKEFYGLLKIVEEKYDTEKKKFADAKDQGIDEPETLWKSTYKKLESFFDHRDNERATGANTSLRQIFLDHILMKDAVDITKKLYVEGKKLVVAEKTGENILGTNYMTVQEAMEKVSANKEDLDKLLYAAIEFENTPPRAGKLFKKAGIQKETAKDIIKSLEMGIIPAKYVQRETAEKDDKKEAKAGTSPLERALKVVANYQPMDKETADKIELMAKLAKHPAIELKAEKRTESGKRLGGIKAQDGTYTKGEKIPLFDIKAYEGKKYIHIEKEEPGLSSWQRRRQIFDQKTAIENAHYCLPGELKNINFHELEKAHKDIAEFYSKFDAYTTTTMWKPTLKKGKIPFEGVHWHFRSPKTIKKMHEEMMPVLEGKESQHYFKIDKDIEDKLSLLRSEKAVNYLKSRCNEPVFPENLDEILKNEKTLFNKDLISAINYSCQKYLESNPQ